MIDRAQVNELLDSDVVDARGERIGPVRQVWLDDSTGQPLWAEVHTGLFGMTDTFVPIQEARMGAGEVVVPVEKKQVKDSPHIKVQGGHMSEEQQDELYRYYGMVPAAATGDHDRLPGGRQDRMTGDKHLAGDKQMPGDKQMAHGKQQADAKHAMGGRQDARTTADGREDQSAGMVRHEEELHAGVRDVEAGRVRLVKHVVTEEQQISVPVTREEVRVVREPADGKGRDDAFSDAEAEVTLHRQEPVVEKTVRPVEEVRLEKETVTDEQTVSGKVRKERIDVEDNTRRDRR